MIRLKRGPLLIVFAILACMAVAWFAKPRSLRKQLAASGIELVEKPYDESARALANFPRNPFGFYKMPKSEAKLRAGLKKAGFQSKFGKSPTSVKPANSKQVSGVTEVFTRGYHYAPFLDYDRVWIVEHDGTTTIVISPDAK